MAKRTFKWTVEFEVDETWVADGFDLDDESAAALLLEGRLSHAYSHEVKARVVKRPPGDWVKQAQGYEKDTRPEAAR